jgi:hypothetical protein
LIATDPFGLDCVRVSEDGTTTVHGDEEDNCEGDNGYYFDGTVASNSVFVDANDNVVASANGSFQCSGDSGCSVYNSFASVSVYGSFAGGGGGGSTSFTITAGDPNAKHDYCTHQSKMAGLEAILPGGSVLLGGDYTPTAVDAEVGKEALSEAVDAGSKSTGFLSMFRSLTGIPMSVTSKVLTGVGYVMTARDLYEAKGITGEVRGVHGVT